MDRSPTHTILTHCAHSKPYAHSDDAGSAMSECTMLDADALRTTFNEIRMRHPNAVKRNGVTRLLSYTAQVSRAAC